MHFNIFNSMLRGTIVLILVYLFYVVQGSFHIFQEKCLCDYLKICMLAHTVPDRFPACCRPRLSTLGVKSQ